MEDGNSHFSFGNRDRIQTLHSFFGCLYLFTEKFVRSTQPNLFPLSCCMYLFVLFCNASDKYVDCKQIASRFTVLSRWLWSSVSGAGLGPSWKKWTQTWESNGWDATGRCHKMWCEPRNNASQPALWWCTVFKLRKCLWMFFCCFALFQNQSTKHEPACACSRRAFVDGKYKEQEEKWPQTDTRGMEYACLIFLLLGSFISLCKTVFL